MKTNETKLLRASIASLLLGRPFGWKIKGTKTEMKALSNALMATKLFEDMLNTDGVLVKEVISMLEKKHRAANRFKRVFGISWPL